MFYKILYYCEICSKYMATDRKAVQNHEASHFNLSLQDYIYWGQLIEKVEKIATKRYSSKENSNEEQQEKELDQAIKQLTTFETQHHLKHEQHPIHFE